MKVIIRWRVVHPAKTGPKVSCRPYVLFEEIVNDVREVVRSCPLDVWPSIQEKHTEATFERMPDLKEPILPEPSPKRRRT